MEKFDPETRQRLEEWAERVDLATQLKRIDDVLMDDPIERQLADPLPAGCRCRTPTFAMARASRTAP
jgi:hypothetical protein